MEISLLENKTIYFIGCSYTWGAGLEMEYYHNNKNWDTERIQKENDMSINIALSNTFLIFGPLSFLIFFLGRKSLNQELRSQH